MFDVGIVGGGISGLYVASRLSRTHKVVLFDDRDYLGGRVRTHKEPRYEVGARRFTDGHRMINRLIKQYGLRREALPVEKQYLDKDRGYVDGAVQHFDSCIQKVLSASNSFSEEELRGMTFFDFCQHVLEGESVSHLVDVFGYRCEFDYLNARDACRTFSDDFSGRPFFTLSDGLSALCIEIARDVRKNGGVICINAKVTDVEKSRAGTLTIVTAARRTECQKVVFAIKPHQMKAFPLLRPVRAYLSTVRAGKLLRIYAQFTVTPHASCWFAGMTRTTTNSILRQIVPISEALGLIMLSYTDGSDVDYFLRDQRVRHDLKTVVMRECRRIFGSIPDPIYFKSHYWSEGCHYWKPSAISSNVVSATLVNPVQDVFTCGEGFSMRQCWIEGALNSADRVVRAVHRIEKKCMLL